MNTIETLDIQVKKSSLIAIVTGLEHSGTTYLSRLITCHPLIDSGFECGVLLADSPKDFVNVQPFYDWMQVEVEKGHWGIEKKDIAQICLAENWEDMYRKIIQYSPVFRDKSSYILDKTPGYMPKLDQILEKVLVPCLVIKKDIFFQYLSFKKRDVSLKQFVSRYVSYMSGLSRALEKFNDRIYIIEYKELYFNTAKKIIDVFDFINLDFRENCSETEFSSNEQNLNLFRKNIKIDPFPRNFKYNKEVEKVKELTEKEINTLKSLEEKNHF